MVHHFLGDTEIWFTVIASLVLAWTLIFYPMLAIWTNERYRRWPLRRYLCWFFGIFLAGAALVGPLADRANYSFTFHMANHVLLGMAAPLFLIYGKPMTLLLRSLPRNGALKVSRLMKSPYLAFIGHPSIAAILNIGGLYLIYRTDIYIWMHQSTATYLAVHLHVFLAGYIFTLSILQADIAAHRHSYLYRSVVLILALAAHKVLAKSLYAMPPAGVYTNDAKTGALVMYYGGDLVDLALIVLLCYSWYKSAAPGRVSSAA